VVKTGYGGQYTRCYFILRNLDRASKEIEKLADGTLNDRYGSPEHQELKGKIDEIIKLAEKMQQECVKND